MDDFIVSETEGLWVPSWDANDMLTLAKTWQSGDISRTSVVEAHYQGDLVRALEAIKAKVFVIASASDMFFPVHSSQKGLL